MDYLINAVAYVTVGMTWVFVINPALWAIDHKYPDYKEAVFAMLIIELLGVGVFLALAAIIFSFNYVFSGVI